MPIPVSATGWSSEAGAQQQAEELTTSGPFARLAQHAGGAVEAAAQPAAPSAAPAAPPKAEAADAPLVDVQRLTFYHSGLDGRPQPGVGPIIDDVSFSLPRGARCLLLGSNGAGKSTLLRILAGKHMVPEGAVRVLGSNVFQDTDLTCNGALAYIGGQWQKEVAFAGYAVPLQGDFPASKMLDSVCVDPARKARLIRALDIDVTWRMHKVSDGQRRRVQLAFGLMRPFSVLLLDEVTVDLDVLARAELMAFLTAECEERGATVIYATHIFDGLERWATHVALLARGKLVVAPSGQVPELSSHNGRLFPFVEAWLRRDAALTAAAQVGAVKPDVSKMLTNNGWGNGRIAPTVAER